MIDKAKRIWSAIFILFFDKLIPTAIVSLGTAMEFGKGWGLMVAGTILLVVSHIPERKLSGAS